MIKDLKDYRPWTWNCYRDSMCKHVFSWHLKAAAWDDVCPPLTRYKFDCFSAQGKMGELARALIEGEIEWNDRLLDIVFKDPLCGACSYNCGRITEMQPTDVIQAMRADALNRGLQPPGGFKDLLADMREHLNPYRAPAGQRADWLKGLDPALAYGLANKTKTKTLLYTGCFPLRDAAGAKMAQDAAAVLLKAGVDLGVLGERERCCGNPSLRLGDTANFLAFAKENIKQFHALGVERIVTLCPFCYSTFTHDYDGVAPMDFEVVHILPLVAGLLKQGKLKPKKKLDLTAAWHDPCHLVRMGGKGVIGAGDFEGIWREPRAILEALPGFRLVEFYRNKHDAWCCGAGSWQRHGDPEMARWTAGERLREAEAVGAQAVVTYCPHCEENLGEAGSARKKPMPVHDLLALLRQSL
jgi:Fe-S oxidoreductase